MAVSLRGQSAEDIEKILSLTGYDAPEQLSEHDVEKFCVFLDRPLKINSSLPSAIRSSGLFSPFQSASLSDYRTRHGDVMSFKELASVPGFNETFVENLKPFISLEGGNLSVGDVSSRKIRNDVAVRCGLKFTDDEITGGYGFKYKCEVGDRLSIALSASEPYSSALSCPELLSGCLDLEFARMPLRIVLGDFNARFGQGLAMWNGLTMSGLSKVSSFFKSASGISPTWSYTGGSSLTGAALEFSLPRVTLTSMLALPDVKTLGFNGTSFLPAISAGWYGNNVFVSLIHYMEFSPPGDGVPCHIPDMKSAAGVSFCLDGTDIFSELAYDWVNRTAAAIAGMITPITDGARIACQLRYYPPLFDPIRSGASRSGSKCTNEYGASVCLGFPSGDVSLDAAYFPLTKEDGIRSMQLKALGDWDFKITEDVVVNVRLTERFRTWGYPSKTDVRTDIIWNFTEFTLATRLNAAICRGFGFLSYVEGGYKGQSVSLYLRQGIFHIDYWDDRIYVYERDAPGSFSVPAFYGRGLWTSLVSSWKFARWGRLYLRASVTGYPFMESEKKKPGKAELKFLFVLSF